MTTYQKTILIKFSSLTALLLLMEANEVNGSILSYSRYVIMFSLCAMVFYGRGRSKEQKMLSWTFVLMLAGDFFLVLSQTQNWFPDEYKFLGFIPFAIAYILMAKTYLKGTQWNNLLMVPAVIYGLSLSILIITISPFVTGIERPLGFLTAFSVSFMAWAGSASVFIGYYKKRTSLMMALSGLLMLICDYGVALEKFYPDALSLRSALPLNLVWLAYLPGWMILALIVVEKDLFTGCHHPEKRRRKTNRKKVSVKGNDRHPLRT